ncbi:MULTISPECIES: hypothetical protein [Stenotrophomonas]|jgi:hypothetical protein|uniref:hypothetical protein n=1 Tax=Stenotrophomonas TaxID=40323 RepID=UPI0007027C6F|nr:MULTISPECIES: hypothetical protein [Stenotrophomonas]KRG84534.1 hypothetical protein ABB33_11215 [Stenotrophomonas acidaminiphila]QOF99617.1 hypothetical protein H7691_05690 [Stenotrophomonas sp. CW117]
MKTAQEIVDSRLVLRSLCAALALMGMAAMAYRVHQVAIGRIPFDYWLPVSLLGALYVACLFGHVALKGRLPSFMARAGGSAGD